MYHPVGVLQQNLMGVEALNIEMLLSKVNFD